MLSLKKPHVAESMLREAAEHVRSTGLETAQLPKIYPALLAFSLQDQVSSCSHLA